MSALRPALTSRSSRTAPVTRRAALLGAGTGLVGLALSACATGGASGGASDAGGSASDGGASAGTVTVEDNNGTHEVPAPPTSVVATDNRLFETLHSWGVTLAAAPRQLIPSTIAYRDDESIVDLGSHREPDLEAVVAAEPDLIINGQRFTQHQAKLAELAPDAVILNLDPREDQPLDAELKRAVEQLGKIFGKEPEATKLADDLDAAVERAKKAYPAGAKVMALNSSGGELGYIAPGAGRVLGPIFPLLGLTPALEIEGASDDHEGDDVSVEAIAQANPDWILVMDRDAAVAADEAGFQPADQVIAGSAALQGVTAVQQGNIVYMPADTYTNEGIQTYTEFLTALAEAMEKKS